MTVTPVNNQVAKILRAIKDKGGTATITDIKRSIAEFNQRGGAERLRKLLADLVSSGTLKLRKDKVGRGMTVESYCLTDNNSGKDSISNSNVNDGTCGNLTIAVTLDTTLDALLEIVHSLLNVDDGNGTNKISNGRNGGTTLPWVDEKDDDSEDDDDDFGELPDGVPF